jgi:hypothetical protein
MALQSPIASNAKRYFIFEMFIRRFVDLRIYPFTDSQFSGLQISGLRPSGFSDVFSIVFSWLFENLYI